MKKIIATGILGALIVVLQTGCAGTAVVAQDSPSGTITYQSFYDDLSPYGTWMDYPNYGHVWHPRIDGDFRPYATNGNWAYSTDGWAWQSNYSWGWAPFHYGRWLYDDLYGWLWVPGYDWSPAWVTWGDVDDYYCWAPLTPGVRIDLQFGSWRPHAFYWNVCDRAHIYDHNLGSVILGNDRSSAIAGRISIINNFYNTRGHNFYSKGPDVHDVERYTNRTITPMKFRDVQHAGQAGNKGNVMGVYRPGVQNAAPHEFKRPDPSQVNPIREGGQNPRIGRMEQHNNMEALPTFRSPSFGGRPNNPGGGSRGGGGRHR